MCRQSSAARRAEHSRVDPAHERERGGGARRGDTAEREGEQERGEHHERAVRGCRERVEQPGVRARRGSARAGAVLQCEGALCDESAPGALQELSEREQTEG